MWSGDWSVHSSRLIAGRSAEEDELRLARWHFNAPGPSNAVLSHMLGFLDLHTRLRKCGPVCRRWEQVVFRSVDSIDVHELGYRCNFDTVPPP